MAKRKVSQGNVWTVQLPPAYSEINSGQLFIFEKVQLCGLALESAAPGQDFAAAVQEGWTVPKKMASGEGYTIGQRVNVDVFTSQVTAAPVSGFVAPLGYVMAPAATGDSTCQVMFWPA